MAFFAWIFFTKIFAAFIDPSLVRGYIAGAIILGADPCTAMGFVWSYLTDVDPNYTLMQVSVNDLIILFAFVPIVGLLLGITDVVVPYETLILSVLIYIVPLVAGVQTSNPLIKNRGRYWFEPDFLPKLKPLSIIALLLTLIVLFTFQGENILNNPFIIVLIAVPLINQTYFIFFTSWFAVKKMNLKHQVCTPYSNDRCK